MYKDNYVESFALFLVKFKRLLIKMATELISFGVNFDTVNASFPSFISEFKREGIFISRRDNFNLAYGLDFEKLNQVRVSEIVDAILEDILQYYCPEVTYSELSDLSEIDEIVDYFDKKLNVFVDNDSFLIDESTNTVSSIDEENVTVTIVNDDINLRMKDLTEIPKIISKRTGISKINVFAFINNMFDAGFICVNDSNNLETMLYYYGLGLAQFDSTSTDLYLINYDADFLKNFKRPGFITREKLLEKPNGEGLFDLFLCFYRTGYYGLIDKIEYVNYLVSDLLQTLSCLKLNWDNVNVKMQFPGNIEIRENHYTIIPKTVALFNGSLILSEDVITRDNLRQMFYGLLLKSCDRINKITIRSSVYVDNYMIMPLNYTGKSSKMAISLDAILTLLFLIRKKS